MAKIINVDEIDGRIQFSTSKCSRVELDGRFGEEATNRYFIKVFHIFGLIVEFCIQSNTAITITVIMNSRL